MDFKPFKIGKFLLMERIATGGMAEVYRGKASGAGGFEKPVAVKRIIPSYSQNEEFRRMFEYEARLSSMLTHANIAQVYDFVKSGDTYMLSMEYVDGKNLRQIINKTKKLNMEMPIEVGVWIINEVCKGLDYAHKKHDDILNRPLSIIHRDMSPQNIMISYEGAVKIVDFGIAKAKDRVDETRSGVIKGKFGYMSPEQASGEEVDHRTDIFSTGIILFELLTGKRLFAADNDMQTLKRIQECIIQRPTLANPKIPIELEKILLKALAKDRELRFQTAGQFQQKLQEFLNKHYPTLSQSAVEQLINASFQQERMLEQKRFSQAYRQSIPFSQGQQDEEIGGVKANLENEPQTKSEKGPNTFVTQGEESDHDEDGTAGPEVNELGSESGTQGDDEGPQINASEIDDVPSTLGGEESDPFNQPGGRDTADDAAEAEDLKLDEPSYQSLSRKIIDEPSNTAGTLGYEIEEDQEVSSPSIRPPVADDEEDPASIPNINLEEALNIEDEPIQGGENETQVGPPPLEEIPLPTQVGRPPETNTEEGQGSAPNSEINLEAQEDEISFVTFENERPKAEKQQTQTQSPSPSPSPSPIPPPVQPMRSDTNVSQPSFRLQTNADSIISTKESGFANVPRSPDSSFSIEDRTPNATLSPKNTFETFPEAEEPSQAVRLLLSLVLLMVIIAGSIYVYLGPDRTVTSTETSTGTATTTKTATETSTKVSTATQTNSNTKTPVSVTLGNCVLNLDSDPSPTAITVDGKKRGNAPTALAIPCGKPITILVQKPGYADLTRSVTVGPEEREQELYITLKKIPSGKLQLNISHRAKVFIDGIPAENDAIPGQIFELILPANKKYKLRFVNSELKIDEQREYLIKESTIKLDRIFLDAKSAN